MLVRKYAEPTFKGWMIEALDAKSFSDWTAMLSSKGVPARTINLARQSCNVPLNDLVCLRPIPWNPLSAVRPYHEQHATRGVLTAEEIGAVLALDPDPRVRLAVQSGAYYGLLSAGRLRGTAAHQVECSLPGAESLDNEERHDHRQRDDQYRICVHFFSFMTGFSEAAYLAYRSRLWECYVVE